MAEITDLLPGLVTTRYHTFHRIAPDAWPQHAGQPLVPVRTSAGNPRFIPAASGWPRCNEIVPWNLLKIEDRGEFTARYIERLEKHGIVAIATRLTQISVEHEDRPLALLCYEDLEKAWCHRRIFADWWQTQTGQVIPEWAATP